MIKFEFIHFLSHPMPGVRYPQGLAAGNEINSLGPLPPVLAGYWLC